ncbi:MAG: hypothetical protein H6707_12660 [Deltaproteobacteria bacterium]|nr:hypothetical protein [Deltaproteobacteria bacterium]
MPRALRFAAPFFALLIAGCAGSARPHAYLQDAGASDARLMVADASSVDRGSGPSFDQGAVRDGRLPAIDAKATLDNGQSPPVDSAVDSGQAPIPDSALPPLPDSAVDSSLPPVPDSTVDGSIGPTGWNPQDIHPSIERSANGRRLSISIQSDNDSARASVGHSSGKYYFEVTIEAFGSGYWNAIGIANGVASLELSAGSHALGEGCSYHRQGQVRCLGQTIQTLSGYLVGDVIGLAVDLDNKRIYFAKNNLWLSGNPATGSGGFSFGNTSTTRYPMATLSTGDAMLAAFEAEQLTFAPPAGYSAGWY